MTRSSAAAAARPAGGLRADYGFVATMDREIRRDPERYVGYGITDAWDEIVETLQGAFISTIQSLLNETEGSGMSREALWDGAMDASDPCHRRGYNSNAPYCICNRSRITITISGPKEAESDVRFIGDRLQEDGKRRESLRAADRHSTAADYSDLDCLQTLQERDIPLQGLVTTTARAGDSLTGTQ
ncbi:hypothetical protein Tco_1553485 [Tanacetum coccineum]